MEWRFGIIPSAIFSPRNGLSSIANLITIRCVLHVVIGELDGYNQQP